MTPRFRYFQLDRAKADANSRMIPVTFSSETPVSRSDDEFGNYEEVLSHDPAHVDLTRLKTNAPFLLGHDYKNPLMHVGTIEAPTIDNDKMGRAMVKMSRSQLGNEVFQDLQDGIRTHVSVGYEISGVVSNTVDSTGKRTVVFQWSPYEISAVPIPADLNASVGRSRARKIARKSLSRSMTNDECAAYCYSAESELISLLEEMEAEGDATDSAAIAKIKEAIAACSVAIKGLQYWSEKTAAECVKVCQETAKVLGETVAMIEATDEDEEDTECAIDCLNMAIEKLNDNAGGETEPATTTEGQTRKLDKAQLMKSGTETAPTPKQESQMRILLDPASKDATGGAPAVKSTEDLRREEMTRMNEIDATVDLLAKDFPTAADKFRSLGKTAKESGTEVRDFKASLIKEIPGAKPAKQTTMLDLTNGDRSAAETYSLSRAIQSCILRKTNVPDGLEGEIHSEMSKRNITTQAGGFWVPPDAMISRRRKQRDLNVNNFGQGGAFVQTTVLTPIIEILRNRMVCDRLGVQGMAGLEGNVAIPRQSGAATAYSLPEQATLTKSTQALDQILLTPHRVGAYNNYSRQLLLQSSVDVENFMRDDLMKVMAIKWDYLILQGQGGGSEPTGILNTAGIGNIIFGGTATWAQVVAFETALSLANADLGNMAFVTSPGVRGRWKAVAKTGVGVTSVVPIFLWDKGTWADGSNDGEVNGYRAAATNQILNNLVFFGNWEDTIHALWGGYDVIVDPYTQATDATVRVTVNTFGDVAVRHASSFCVSEDAGNQ